jgi:hypothetical protein
MILIWLKESRQGQGGELMSCAEFGLVAFGALWILGEVNSQHLWDIL